MLWPPSLQTLCGRGAEDYLPVPETAITSGLLVVESVTITVPPRVRMTLGAKEILQVLPAAITLVQVVP